MRSRVVVQKRLTTVECAELPKDIGGNGSSYKELAAKWKQLVEDNVNFYQKYENYKSILAT